MKHKNDSWAKNGFYWGILIGFFIILTLPIFELPPYLFPPDWGKTVVFKIVFSIILFIFAWKTIWDKNPDLFNSVKKINLENISFWFLVSLLTVYFLATIFSVDTSFSLWGSPYRGGGAVNYIFYILFAILLFLTVQKKDWQKLWDVAIFSGILVCSVALISYFKLLSNIFVSQTDALTSTIGGPTVLGIYILTLVFPTLSFATKEQNRSKKIFYFFAFFLFCWIILLTISQGAYIGIIIGLLYFFFLYPKKIYSLKIWVAILMLLFVAFIVFIKYLPQNPINNNYLFHKATEWRMDQSRLSAWKVSWKAFLSRPIFGYGPENFQTGFDKYYDPSLPLLQRDPSTSGSWWDRAHNLFLNTLVETGLSGFIAFALTFIFIFFQLYKIRRIADSANKIVAHGIQTAFIAYFADAFFNFDSFSSFLIIFLIVGYSLSLIIKEQDNEEKEERKSAQNKLGDIIFKNRKPIVSFLFLALIIFIWFFNIKPTIVNSKINIAQYYADQKMCEQSFNLMERYLPEHTIIDSYFRIKYVDFLKKCALSETGNDVVLAQKGVKLLKENVKIMPLYTRNWLVLGALENVLIAAEKNPEAKKDLINQAESHFQKAYELSPKRQEVFIEWTKKDLVSEDYQKALEKSDTCIKLNPDMPDCYWLKGVSKIYLKDELSAENNFKMAKDRGFDSNNLSYLNQLVNAYSSVKDYKSLAQTYQKLISLRGDVPQYHASLAFTYRELGEFKKAKEETLTFLRLMPEARDEVDEFLKTLPH